MALEVYRRKRNFAVTPEPKGRTVKRRAQGLQFVIQKHAASHLHYDFRLELNGVLLSWAVPKGPSLDPADKRLAMHVEDHPIEYGEFEGIIPAKQYGAGTVLLWDRGTWEPKEDPEAGYRKGKLKFELHGEKLKGGWVLVRSHGGKYDGEKSWLLIKENDEFARRGAGTLAVDDQPQSVVSGRTLEDIAHDPDREWHSNKSVAENVAAGEVRKRKPRMDLARVAGARKMAMPELIEPQLATLVKSAPEGGDWLHEMKYDGYRMLCRIEDGNAAMVSRNAKDWTDAFAGVARSAARLPVESAWIDGEVVVLLPDGRSSFQALQNALSGEHADRLHYFVFDLPYLNGYDLRGVPLHERKALLHRLLEKAPARIRESVHIAGGGKAFFEQGCRLGLEGIVSKRADSLYRAGRGRDWVKVKCAQRQELVIGGFTDPEGSRRGFGALHLGVYEADGKLRYAGKVGTGFDDALLRSLRGKLDELVQERPPFIDPPKGAEARRSHWVQPKLVAEVSFTEWTDDGTLRHPSFQGLREDKRAQDVVRERPVASDEAQDAPAPAAAEKTARKPTTKARKIGADDDDTVAGVRITNPDKVLYPEAKLTKRDLAEYYAAVGERMLPHVAGRPLTLVRCPNGWEGKCFYQKHVDAAVPEVIDRVEVQESEKIGVYTMANSVSAIVALLQMGVLEMHPWGALADSLDRPDRIIFDFDPDDGLPWVHLTQSVRLLKTLLGELGLEGFLKTTGGKGLHVVVPVEPRLPWETVKGFTKAVAELLTHTFPDRFTAKLAKQRREGRVFLDYLRNAEGATAVAAYSTRARTNAPVSMPLSWTELKRDVRFDCFNVRNVAARLAHQKKDPWEGFAEVKQAITPAMMKQVGYRK
jgi:bifunctional non-homologous end joining protein LigD